MAETQTPPIAPETMSEQAQDETASDVAFTESQNASASDEPLLSWTASEFIAHHKTSNWYVTLAAVALGLAILIWLLTKDKISAAIVLFGAFLFGVYAGREPRQLPYRLYEHGFSIGEKYHQFDEFKSFGVVPEGAFSSIVFLPLKRFGQSLTIYYAPDDEDKIIDVLSDRLPYADHQHDLVDSFMRHIRF